MCDEPITFQRWTVRARKAHRCFECPRVIQPGEVYERESGIWPDGPMSFKTCLTCAALTSLVHSAMAKDYDFCLEHGAVWETAEYYGLISWVKTQDEVKG